MKTATSRKRHFDPEKIQKARVRRGWTRTALAYKVKMSESAITRIEKGQRENPESIARIAKVLKVTVESLMVA